MIETSKSMSNSIGPSPPNVLISDNPTITNVKLDGTNYLSWSVAAEIWFKGQGVKDHLEKKSSEISSPAQPNWEKLDAQLCAVLWQLQELCILGILS